MKATFTSPNTFAFNPDTTPMGSAGRINMHRDPGSADWTFVSVNGLRTPEYSWTVTGSGITITDNFTPRGASSYTVAVHGRDGDHTSGPHLTETQPPMIVNQ